MPFIIPHMKKRVFCLGLLCCLQIVGATQPVLFQTQERFHPELGLTHMVASQEAKASKVGDQVLAHGGNAVDAAVAVGFALAVTLPRAGNLGGGGFMMVWLNEPKKAFALDYREMAAASADVKQYLDADGEPDEEKVRWHYLSSGVPGTVKGLLTAHAKWGRLPREAVLKPAIELAEHGFKMTPGMRAGIFASREHLLLDPAARKIFFKPDGSLFNIGDRIVQRDLAKTLKLIAAEGEKAFYEGAIARQIVDAMKKNQGLVTLKDLKHYKVKLRKPVKAKYRGKTIYSMPPPSSGGITLVQMLNMLDHLSFKHIKANTAHYFHILAEVMNYAYNDRNTELGDPDFVSIPMRKLTSQKYAKQLIDKIDLKRHTPAKDVAKLMSAIAESVETTHYSVIDREGNMVANTYTLNYSFGNGHVIPGAGFLMNNQIDDFTIKPGVPNAYGLVQGNKNLLKAKKRPLSSMTPTLVINEDDSPMMALGTPGGSQIITGVLQVILHVIDEQMSIATAVAIPRIHSQLWPDKLFVEQGVSRDTIKLLKERGHRVEQIASMGSMQVVSKQGGYARGFSDPRRMGALAVGD